MDVSEGAVSIEVPEASGGGEGAASGVFFNPDQELNRDITVAVLRAFGDREERAERYFDATAASGIRGVRAAAEGWDVTMADVDADAVSLARDNLDRNDLEGEVLLQDANAVLHDVDRVFDVVDVDPFGSPVPFADAAFANTRDLVCVTATDTAPLCGAHFESGVRRYSAVPRNTEDHAEMGLRVLLSTLARTAARYDVGVRPVLSHVTDHYVRTYLELDHRATDADAALDELGNVHHCPECLYREWEYGLLEGERQGCPHCGGDNVVTAGPVWLGPAHDADFVRDVREHLSEEMGRFDRARDTLETIADELHVPFHYNQHKLYKRWGESAIAMDDFLAVLRDAGHEASRTHFGGTRFKTEADVGEIREAVLAAN
ncbi:tRNA (guanine(26)-N(2))-dimethyltransferase [Halospeciosus flavus]|uniref:tRNA (guanine(26)-N(2))-dimethyltransferase n=1 Tax=Halospeciosus flavus TaxID=3032283 RepID=A0ABD5Z7R4_9EURY|nr:tRNA (guanine(26)-N(2))-dimethyltransferase [Halospeciosus flavus]